MRSVNEPQESVVIKSILVIDDHPLYCEALAMNLEQTLEAKVVKKATSLIEGLRLLGARFSPDLVILDLKLPDATGVSGLIKIKDKIPDVPVLMISAESSNEIINSLITAGAAGFIPKEATHKVLQMAIKEIREGRRYLPPGYTHSSSPSHREMSSQQIAQKIANLTPQQSRIMNLICSGKPNKQIAHEMSLAEATVKAHITALLRRLGVNNRTQAAVLAKSASLGEVDGLSDTDVRALLR